MIKRWIVEYSTTDNFFKENEYFLEIRKEFKSELAAVSFVNDLKRSDAKEKVQRKISFYYFDD